MSWELSDGVWDKAGACHPREHQGRHQECWDGLKCGPDEPSGKEKLSDALRALTAPWYLVFTAFLCFKAPSMQ